MKLALLLALPCALPFVLPSSPASTDDAAGPSTATSSPAQGGALTRIRCDGTAVGGSGGPNQLDFYYRIDTKGNWIDRIDIGVDYLIKSQYTSVEAPPGWQFDIVPDFTGHDVPATGHGRLTNRSGNCQYVMRWTRTNPMVGVFYIGFNHPGQIHDVEWDTSDGAATAWNARVGRGQGPIHAPGFADSPIGGDTVSGERTVTTSCTHASDE